MKKLLRSYTNLYKSHSEIYSPSSINELLELFSKAKRESKKISFAAGMSSFDSHFLNDDIVIHMKKFNNFEIDMENKTITAQAGVEWGDVLRELTPRGLTMPSTVTTRRATVGGTLSGNCLSQFSMFLGKESHHIFSLKLLTVDGQVINCSENEHQDIFKAVIGGFGWLGAVMEATYTLRSIGDKQRIKTILTKHNGFDEVVDFLEDARQSKEWEGAYATVFLHGKKDQGFIFREKYTDKTNGKPYFYFQPDKKLRIVVEALAVTPGLRRILSRLNYLFTKNHGEYVNELENNIFFMDGNRNFRNLTSKFGIHIKTAQQTYVTPTENTKQFLNHVGDVLRKNKLIPSAIDTLFIPQDDVLLSSNNGRSGYANSIAYLGIYGRNKVRKIKEQLAELNDVCHTLGGRTYFVKNVFVSSSEQIAEMYGSNLDKFLDLKKALDPMFVLRNELFDRIFGNANE